MQEEREAGENSDAGFGVGKGLGLSPTGAPVPAVGADSTCRLSRQRAGSHSLLTLPGTQAKAKNQNQVEELVPVKQAGNGEGCAGNAKMDSGSLEGFRWSLFPRFLSSCILKTFHSKGVGRAAEAPAHGGLESRPRARAVAAAERCPGIAGGWRVTVYWC